MYGLNRLASLNGSTTTWYAQDALGSVRRTFNTSATPLGIVNYDPWGTPESGTVPTFGFTGELQDTTTGLVNLRARWYSTSQGKFTTVDPFVGEPAQPYSQHPYAYAYSDPVLVTDRTGLCGATGQGDDYCHTDTSGNSDPDAYASILCVGRGGDWDAQHHVCRERLRPPAPNNEQPPAPYPIDSKKQEKDRDSRAADAEAGVLGGRRGGKNTGILVGGALLACLWAALNALERAGPITWPQARTQSDEAVSYYRVQGGTGPISQRSQFYFTIIAGNLGLTAKGATNNVNVSRGDPLHALYFLGKRPGASIYTWKVPKWFDDLLMENAVAQYKYNENPRNQGGTAPKIVDPNQPGSSIELPQPWPQWMVGAAIPGSAQIIDLAGPTEPGSPVQDNAG